MAIQFPIVLSIAPTTPFGRIVGSILQQIDSRLTILGNGSPVGTVQANLPGVFYVDQIGEQLYICLSTDQTISGTVWQLITFSFSEATLTGLGLIQLASDSDVEIGTDDFKSVNAHQLAEFYARSGVNSDITELSGLVTAILTDQGGTGLESSGAAGNILISNGSVWTSQNLYGAGADGGNLAGGSPVLAYTSATRYTYSGSPAISLPAPNASFNGIIFSFKSINTPGTGYATWSVAGSSNVEGASTFTDQPFTTQGRPCTDIELRNGAWWVR